MGIKIGNITSSGNKGKDIRISSSTSKTVVKCSECKRVLLIKVGSIDFDTKDLVPCPRCGCKKIDCVLVNLSKG